MATEEIRNWIAENFRNDNLFDWILPENFQTKIVPILPRELKVVELPPIKDRRYNCFIFAFGLTEDKEFLVRSPDSITPLSMGSHAQKLISKGILIPTKSPEAGDYIIYKNNNDITHAGIVKGDDLIISKWSDGPTIEHSILAVNPQYGTDISFYKKQILRLLRISLQPATI